MFGTTRLTASWFFLLAVSLYFVYTYVKLVFFWYGENWETFSFAGFCMNITVDMLAFAGGAKRIVNVPDDLICIVVSPYLTGVCDK